ncbi:Gp37 family protein [Pasteurella skyensis]|uniref:Gp37 family protein n=1 Tax=Phocoenobacter skyensis TaxID=97481 RepID=A0AAJ6N9C4_9PAST|nr:Gp37 family protein [Pasteurella skyensis]MDP8162807.1 Gp37 family protein [Pasteurella skyensis]MDP8172606.1 Gp37 family protein [Pasteurella skyensis]MDP8179106.1 Gp37 family protein [Pasteurella skyensis]MDP8183209.1 Gp37 family protein [Pasteurella skyensis]MDP8189260.1 Gp37 family protein [Pasteurella skyensis]
MSATLPILTALKHHLSDQFLDWGVDLMPNVPANYYLAHPNGAIIISYAGSKFGAKDTTNVVIQDRVVHIAISVIARNLHDDVGALNVLDELRLAIVGFEPPNCRGCWLVEEAYDGNDENTGVWIYQLIVATSTMQVERIKQQNLSKLVEVINRRKDQPLDKKLTTKEGI